MNYRVEYRDQNWIAAEIEAASPAEAAQLYFRQDSERRWQDYDEIVVFWGLFGRQSESFLVRDLLPLSGSEPPEKVVPDTLVHTPKDVVGTTISRGMKAVNTQRQKEHRPPLLPVSGLLCGVIGFYCGTMLFIPFVGGIVVLLLAKRFASADLKPFIGTLAIHFGLWLWMLVDGILGPIGLAPVIIDLLLIFVGLVWLVVRPSLGPIVLLCIYQVLSLVVNIIAICGQEFDSVWHRALTASIALRLFAVGALLWGYRQFRKSRVELVTNAA